MGDEGEGRHVLDVLEYLEGRYAKTKLPEFAGPRHLFAVLWMKGTVLIGGQVVSDIRIRLLAPTERASCADPDPPFLLASRLPSGILK